ncbi:TM2 domain-containing protein [Pseudarthrobacter chlorophenolicus]|nr:TM2 domain-containing protein [Pseudarthrobacter chlorophenolicus]
MDHPFTDLVVDHLEGNKVAGGVPLGPGLQLPHGDVDAPGFSLPPHAQVSFPPGASFEPADRLGADDPGAPIQLKRNRNALRVQSDDNFLHAAETTPTTGAAPLTRRALRDARTVEQPVIRAATHEVSILDLPDPESFIAAELSAGEQPAPGTRTLASPAGVEPEASEEADAVSAALAADLEAALNAALEEEPPAGRQPQAGGPSHRQQRLTMAMALANDEPVDHLPALPPLPTAGSEYASMLASYGAFPPLLPPARDFRIPLLLSVLLGLVGADRFYERKYLSGALKLVTFGGLGIWWVADIILILTGKAEDRSGRPFTGARKHRAISWTLVAALFAGLVPVAVTTAAPAVTGGTGAIGELLFPKPEPVPSWAVVAEVAGQTEPTVLDITGDRLRLSYNFAAPAYVYLQKVGSTPVPAQTVLLTDTPAKGQKDVEVTPGRYQVIVRTDGTSWTVKAEEWGVHG